MDGTYYLLNVENVHLLNYCKKVKNEEVEAVKYIYQISMMLIGMSLVQDNTKGTNQDQGNLSELSMKYSKLIAPLLLPMVRDVGTIFH